MEQSKTISKLKKALSKHAKPSSDYDLNTKGMPPKDMVLRDAAVLVPLVISGSQPMVILTKRSSKLKHHPGQVSFPGGKREDSDKDLEQTALRETYEEIGLIPSDAKVIGSLPTHQTVTSFSVTPFVALIEKPFTPMPDHGEVEEVFTVPFSFLSDLNNYSVQYRFWRGEKRFYYTVPYGPYYIWGATARILFGLANTMAS